MPAPSMSGKEIAGRLIALEAVIIALASEAIAEMPPDKAQAMFATVKTVSQNMVDDLAPDFSPTPPLVKDIEQFADRYVELWLGMIGKAAAKIRKDRAVPAE